LEVVLRVYRASTRDPSTTELKYYTRLIKPEEAKTGNHYHASLLALKNKKTAEEKRQQTASASARE
jgi:hypothetical protein